MDVFSRRPGFHPRTRRCSHPRKLVAIRQSFGKQLGKRSDLLAGIHEACFTLQNQVLRGPHEIAGDHWTPAQHGFIDHNGEWLVFGRQHHDIRRGVNRGKLRLIDKSEETDAPVDNQSHSIRLELMMERSFARENQKRSLKIGLRKSAQEIARSLPRLQLRAEKNHCLPPLSSPPSPPTFPVAPANLPS